MVLVSHFVFGDHLLYIVNPQFQHNLKLEHYKASRIPQTASKLAVPLA